MFTRWLRECLSTIKSWLSRRPRAVQTAAPRPKPVRAQVPARSACGVGRAASTVGFAAERKPASPVVVVPETETTPPEPVVVAPEPVLAAPEPMRAAPTGPVRWSFCEACGHAYVVSGTRGARRRGCDRPRRPRMPLPPPPLSSVASVPMSH